ncbi:uncharacterized protein LOC119402803 [Rhipicephalus sanguineus]|uniref:uncharacterized protein LOC119402803 n=1 Tax=Rhipicephalus sanguineus TaxID=34632 RepID=UPI00189341AE|nr:uncharacterized protein LOC119402803 [Rhipicephalus sanguineus]
MITGRPLAVLFSMLLLAYAQQCPSNYSPRCPPLNDMVSTCQFKEPCTEKECKTQGKLCCKAMACGGCACVDAVDEASRAAVVPNACPNFSPPIDGCEDQTPANATCESLKCKSSGKICCSGPCGDPFCA